jgi:hypothetical protein
MTKYKKILLFVFLICGIILPMGLFNWGALPKAQDNAQTIDEAITAAIIAHEHDATSHLGDGESLQQHKNNEIIDHPATSIVPDKFSGFQKFNYPALLGGFESEFHNVYIGSDMSNYQVYQTSLLSGDGYVYLFQLIPSSEGYSTGDILLDFKLVFTLSSGTAQGRFDFGFAGIEFKSGYYRLRYYTTSWQVSSWIAHTGSFNQHWRVSYSTIDNKLYFYLNDLEVYSVSGAVHFESSFMNFYLYLNRGTSTSAKFWLANLAWYLES